MIARLIGDGLAHHTTAADRSVGTDASLGNFLGGWANLIELRNWCYSTKAFDLVFQLSTFSGTIHVDLPTDIDAAFPTGVFTSGDLSMPITDNTKPLVNLFQEGGAISIFTEGTETAELTGWRGCGNVFKNSDDGLYYVDMVGGGIDAGGTTGGDDDPMDWSVSNNVAATDGVIGSIFWGRGTSPLGGSGSVTGNISIIPTAWW